MFQFVNEKLVVYTLESGREVCVNYVRLVSLRYGLPRRGQKDSQVTGDNCV